VTVVLERRGPVAVLTLDRPEELDAFALAFTTEDQSEGMAAVFEKRPPEFTGR
jgi:enoyl-CoA hydratase/carnithine racemase